MREVTVKLKSIATYSQSRKHDIPKLNREQDEAHDLRTWREHCHYNSDHKIFIPCMAFKIGLDSAARKLGERIPCKGKATYTKYFLSECFCLTDMPINLSVDDVEMIKLSCDSKGERRSSGGKRERRS